MVRAVWGQYRLMGSAGRVARNSLRRSALCQPVQALMSLSEKVVTTFPIVNVTSAPAAVPIALGDGGRCGGQNSSSSSMNSVGS